MALTKHIVANYLGVAVTTVLTFAVVPFYLKWLGPNAYGLIGIAAMLQGWLLLFNAGLAPVVGRQAAQAQGGLANWRQTMRFIRTVDWVLVGLSLLTVCAVIGARHELATQWLKNTHLDGATVEMSLVLLVASTLIRLATSVSRGVIINLEAQVWVNANLILFNCLRFVASLPLIYLWPDINLLFAWWLLVSVAEYVSVQRKITQSVPVSIPLFTFDLSELKKHGKLAATLALTGGIWIVIANLDKLLLSGMLSLADYGYYSIATLLASGVVTLAQPVSQAFQPRLTKAYAEGGVIAVCHEFRQCTRWMVLCVFPIGALLVAMPETILYLWTHDKTVAAMGANILRGYVIGSVCLAAGTLMYAVQVAIGNVTWHLRGHLIFAAVFIPTLPWVVWHYGALGAAYLWAGFNVMLFLLWNGLVLQKLLKPLFPTWLISDTLLPMLTSVGIALIVERYISDISNNVGQVVCMVVLALSIFCVLWVLSIRQRRYAAS